jgi:hypothetical protein
VIAVRVVRVVEHRLLPLPVWAANCVYLELERAVAPRSALSRRQQLACALNAECRPPRSMRKIRYSGYPFPPETIHQTRRLIRDSRSACPAAIMVSAQRQLGVRGAAEGRRSPTAAASPWARAANGTCAVGHVRRAPRFGAVCRANTSPTERRGDSRTYGPPTPRSGGGQDWDIDCERAPDRGRSNAAFDQEDAADLADARKPGPWSGTTSSFRSCGLRTAFGR